MGKTVNWGILGAAKIADEWVAPAIHMSARGRIAMIASRTPGKAEAMAGRFGAAVTGDYDALLADPSIDAVYIPLPNTAHVEWTLRALDAGKHVLCEKPIAMAADDIDQLIAARDRTGLVAAEAYMVTHHPQWRRVRKLVSTGVLGELVQVQGAFSYNNPDMGNIRNQPRTGGGGLPDIGVYPCVTTRFVTGQEPRSIRARVEWENGVDTSAWVNAEFDGFNLQFYCSMRMSLRQQMVFHGTDAVLSVEAPFNARSYGDEVLTLTRGDVVTKERFAFAEQYRAQIDAFNTAVLDGVDFPCSLEFSRGNQAMIDAIYAAAKTEG